MSQCGEQQPQQNSSTEHDYPAESVHRDEHHQPHGFTPRRFPTLFGFLIAAKLVILFLILKTLSFLKNHRINHSILRLMRWIILSVELDFSTYTSEQLEALLLSNELQVDQKKILAEEELKRAIGTLPTKLCRHILKGSDPYCFIDTLRGLYMHLHHVAGPVDESYANDADNLISEQYEPLRHFVASTYALSEHDGEDGKEIAILRITKEYHPLQRISQECLEAASRLVNLDDPQDISLYYQQVEGRRRSALASRGERLLLLNGAVGFICLSYRHRKHSRERLGLSQTELLNALSKFRRETRSVAKSGRISMWWDSNLKCQDFLDEQVVSQSSTHQRRNWVTTGLLPYCVSHVLSIRRSSGAREGRMWIDMEEACARASKGMTVVYLTSDGPEDVMFAHGDRVDPIWAFGTCLYYFLSGDAKESVVTFDEDRDMLRRAALKLACAPLGLAVFRVLYGVYQEEVKWVHDLGIVLARVFGAEMRTRLGKNTMDNGEGGSFVDFEIEHPNGFVWDRRKMWYPNCELWGLEYDKWSDNEWDKENKMVEIRPFGTKKDVFCMMYWYQNENTFQPELIHAVIANMQVNAHETEYVKSTSRAILTTEDELLLNTLAAGVECVDRERVRFAAIRLCELNESEYDATKVTVVPTSDEHWAPTGESLSPFSVDKLDVAESMRG